MMQKLYLLAVAMVVLGKDLSKGKQKKMHPVKKALVEVGTNSSSNMTGKIKLGAADVASMLRKENVEAKATKAKVHDDDVHCYDFMPFAAGTIVDSGYPEKTVQIANGQLSIRINKQASGVATLGVIKSGQKPVAYINEEGVKNSCLDLTGGAGLTLLPKDETEWDLDASKGLSKKRKRMAKDVYEISFDFTGAKAVTFFALDLADLGDWNAYKVAKHSAVASLIAYDANTEEIGRQEYAPAELGSDEYDNCQGGHTLRVEVPSGSTCTDTNKSDECIKTVKLVFRATMGDGSTIAQVWDPNFSVSKLCWPNANGGALVEILQVDGAITKYVGSTAHEFETLAVDIPDFRVHYRQEASETGVLIKFVSIRAGVDDANIYGMDKSMVLNGNVIAEGEWPMLDANGETVAVVKIEGNTVTVTHASGSYLISIHRNHASVKFTLLVSAALGGYPTVA